MSSRRSERSRKAVNYAVLDGQGLNDDDFQDSQVPTKKRLKESSEKVQTKRKTKFDSASCDSGNISSPKENENLKSGTGKKRQSVEERVFHRNVTKALRLSNITNDCVNERKDGNNKNNTSFNKSSTFSEEDDDDFRLCNKKSSQGKSSQNNSFDLIDSTATTTITKKTENPTVILQKLDITDIKTVINRYKDTKRSDFQNSEYSNKDLDNSGTSLNQEKSELIDIRNTEATSEKLDPGFENHEKVKSKLSVYYRCSQKDNSSDYANSTTNEKSIVGHDDDFKSSEIDSKTRSKCKNVTANESETIVSVTDVSLKDSLSSTIEPVIIVNTACEETAISIEPATVIIDGSMENSEIALNKSLESVTNVIDPDENIDESSKSVNVLKDDQKEPAVSEISLKELNHASTVKQCSKHITSGTEIVESRKIEMPNVFKTEPKSDVDEHIKKQEKCTNEKGKSHNKRESSSGLLGKESNVAKTLDLKPVFSNSKNSENSRRATRGNIIGKDETQSGNSSSMFISSPVKISVPTNFRYGLSRKVIKSLHTGVKPVL